MNRYLLAGCAAVALTVGCGSAFAQFEVKVGGDVFFEAGIVGQDQDTNLRAMDFRNRFRLVVTPTAKADNGLTYGARVRLRANKADADVDGDRAFVFLEGAFGRVDAGVVDGVSDNTYVGHPQDYKIFGLYDMYRAYVVTPLAGGNGAGVNGPQLFGSSGAGTKINYYSPRFNGFQVALTYMPTSGDVNTSLARNKYAAGGGVGGTAASYQDVYEVTANYAGEFNGVGVKVGGGYSGGSATADAAAGPKYKNLSSWNVGANLAYAGFAVGAGYTTAGESGQEKSAATLRDDYSSWNVGLQYTTGPWVMGGSYFRTIDAGSLAVRGDRELDAWTAGLLYTVAPGLRTGFEYTYFDQKSDVAAQKDNGSVVLLRTAVNF